MLRPIEDLDRCRLVALVNAYLFEPIDDLASAFEKEFGFKPLLCKDKLPTAEELSIHNRRSACVCANADRVGTTAVLLGGNIDIRICGLNLFENVMEMSDEK